MTLVAIEEISKVCATSGPDPRGAGARLARDQARRHRRAEAALPAAARERRVARRLRADRARLGLGLRRRCAPRRGATATSTSSTAPSASSRTPASRGLYVVFAKTDPDAGPRGHLGVRRRGGHARVRGRPDRAEDGDQGLDDRRALLQRLPRPGREPARRGGRGLPARDADPRPLAAGHRRAGRSGSRRARPTTRSSTRGRARRWASRSRQHQLVAGMLADMETKCEAARGLLYRCGPHDRRRASRAPELTKLSAMAKLFCTDVAMEVTTDAVQVLGGYGYMQEYPVERMMRDAEDHADLRGHEPDPAARDRARDAERD